MEVQGKACNLVRRDGNVTALANRLARDTQVVGGTEPGLFAVSPAFQKGFGASMAKDTGAPGTYRNALLNRLSPEVLQKLALQAVQLDVRKVLYEPNQEIEYAYFPEAGVLSVVSVMEDGNSIEVGTIGREGMACSALMLKAESVPYRYFVQVEGHGYRVGAGQLTAVANANESLRDVILKFESTFRIQTMQGMACNGLHNIQQRCCRWLLMTRDRVDSDDLKLTHEFLALMLGVRRSSVTEVLGAAAGFGTGQVESRDHFHSESQSARSARLRMLLDHGPSGNAKPDGSSIGQDALRRATLTTQFAISIVTATEWAPLRTWL